MHGKQNFDVATNHDLLKVYLLHWKKRLAAAAN